MSLAITSLQRTSYKAGLQLFTEPRLKSVGDAAAQHLWRKNKRKPNENSNNQVPDFKDNPRETQDDHLLLLTVTSLHEAPGKLGGEGRRDRTDW